MRSRSGPARWSSCRAERAINTGRCRCDSKTLIVIAPAGLEAFFREMGVRIAAGATPLEAMTALSETHDAHPVP